MKKFYVKLIALVTLVALSCSILVGCNFDEALGALGDALGGDFGNSQGGNNDTDAGDGGGNSNDSGSSDKPSDSSGENNKLPTITYLEINGADRFKLELGQTRVLIIDQKEEVLAHIEWSIEGDAVEFSDDVNFGDLHIKIIGKKLGVATVTAKYGALTASVTVTVVPVGEGDPVTDSGNTGGSNGGSGDAENGGSDDVENGDSSDNNGNNNSGNGGGFNGDEDDLGGGNGNTGSGNLPSDDKIDLTSDPYEGMTAEEFYASYKPAENYIDAYYRSRHGFMSGSLDVPTSAAPVLSDYQPSSGGLLLRNTDMHYTNDGNTYVVYDAYGNEAFRVHKGGAYVVLEEVAAYMFAFGGSSESLPANYTSNKSGKPSNSIWGKYLRLNHSAFSGDTVRYPTEPELPNIMGCGGSLQYWEMDVGTTAYNNGTKITRSTCRIVYGRNDFNRNGIYERHELHLFYTYNHYEDFQEYLNYEGGWGYIFGYESREAGTYEPSPYIEVRYSSFTGASSSVAVLLWIPCFDERRCAA